MIGKRLIVALCSLAAIAHNVAPAAEKPNIIYILADDLGYGDLGCFGQPKILTPNIDRLCYEGMKFTNHHSGSTVCAPSRAVLMTGKHTGHCTVRGNGDNQNLKEGAEDITIEEVFERLISSSHFPSIHRARPPHPQPFSPAKPGKKGVQSKICRRQEGHQLAGSAAGK